MRKGYSTVKKIVCIGDSLTEGDYGVKGKSCIANVKPENYPYFLAKELGCETVNYGKCGYNAQTYLDFYDSGEVNVTDADVIIVMLGTNLGLGEDKYRNAYSALTEKILKDKSDRAVLVLVTPISATTNPSMSNYHNGKFAAWVVNANEYILGDIANRYKDRDDVAIIDAYRNSPIQPDMEYEYQNADGLHLTESGYAAFAKYIAEEIKELL